MRYENETELDPSNSQHHSTFNSHRNFFLTSFIFRLAHLTDYGSGAMPSALFTKIQQSSWVKLWNRDDIERQTEKNVNRKVSCLRVYHLLPHRVIIIYPQASKQHHNPKRKMRVVTKVLLRHHRLDKFVIFFFILSFLSSREWTVAYFKGEQKWVWKVENEMNENEISILCFFVYKFWSN